MDMRTKVKKWLKIALCSAGALALLILSGIIGMHIERDRQKALELQKEHVSTIAVVNMDNGVRVGNEHINYASQLMSFPNDHFVVTGLTDAKAGIENGTYAAYVVIPETFSESVVSIENNPKKVMLVYQYNNKLIVESEIQAVNDVNAFIVLLNSNTAYMYLDAIMAEFHRIQDDSSTILANDNKELELLAGVNAAKLIAAAEPVEETSVNHEIQPVELTAYTTRNRALLDNLLFSYSEAFQKGKEDYTVIQKENNEVEIAADNFLLAYDAVIQDTAEEHARLLTEGRDKLAEAVSLCSQSDEVQEEALKSLVADIISMQLEADRKSAESQLQEIIEIIRNSDDEALKDLQQRWETEYQDLRLKVDETLVQKSGACRENLEELVKDAYVQGYCDALDDLGGQIDSLKEDADSKSIAVNKLQEAIDNNMSSGPFTTQAEDHIGKFEAVVREQLDSISIDWDPPDMSFPEVSGRASDGNDEEDGESYAIFLTTFNDEEAIDSVVRETLDLFKMKSESEQIDDVIQTYFVDALSEESKRQMARLSDEKQLLSQTIKNYEASLVGFDPLQYVENADLNACLNDIEANTGEMLHTVEQNNSDYMLYATEMYTHTTERISQVRKSLDEAYSQTTENVTDCINDLISSREAINSQNVSLLEGFANSLRYTRVESQGNAEVYDYIVNPVVSQISGLTVANTAEPALKKGNPMKVWLVLVLGIGILLCLAEVVIDFRQQYEKQAEKDEDEDMF